jgi:site-specific recombinase XerC
LEDGTSQPEERPMSVPMTDPRRRVLSLPEWPDADRRAWQAAIAPADVPSFTQRSAAAGLAAATLRKTMGGYGRWLGFLDRQGWLEPQMPAIDRVTPERVAAYFDELRAVGNADHTIIGRFQELEVALRLVGDGRDMSWLRKPGGVALRRRLPMRRRLLVIPHSRDLYEWGIGMMTQAMTLAGPDRRRVMLRDGLLIAIAAARGMRLRSLAGLQLGQHVVRATDGIWWVVLDEIDVKTEKPIEYPLPTSLQTWVERYLAVERQELLAGRLETAFWLNWSGRRLGLRGVEKRIRWWSEKRFGKEGTFGPHRFRHAIGTTGPIEDPAAAPASGALLGITGRVHEMHYNRGRRAAAAKRFHEGLARLRRETGGLAERLFAERQIGATTEEGPDR